MTSTIRNLAFLVLAIFGAAVLPVIGTHNAGAVENNLGNTFGVQTQTGTLSATNPSDGTWVFVSGQRPRLTVIAATRTPGANLGTLAVYNQQGQRWVHWDSARAQSKSMSQVVLPGWNYIRLYAAGGQAASYEMNISQADTHGQPDAGNTFDTAKTLTLAPDAAADDRVSAVDTEDYFRFTVPFSAPGRARHIDIHAFNAFGGAATFELYRLDGNIANFVAGNTSGTLAEYAIISRQLPPATYFVRVSKNDGAGTAYRLYINSTDVDFDDGGSLEQAASLGTRGQVFDTLTAGQDAQDLYWFQPAATSVVNIGIAKNSGDLKAYLLDEGRNILQTSTTNGNSEWLTATLARGTYHVLVTVQSDSAAYSISRREQRAVTPVVVPMPSSDSPEDRNIKREILRDNQFVYVQTEAIGGIDTTDWSFLSVPARSGRPTERRGFLVEATGLPAGATVAFYNPTSSTPFDSRTASAAGTVFFGATFPPGVVDVLVSVPAGTPPSTYTLTLSCTGGCPQ